MTKDAARDLIALFITLALIVAGMLAYNKKFREPNSDATKDWYYERIAPPNSTGQRSR